MFGLAVRAFVSVLLVAAAAHAEPVRFGPWHGACAPGCRLATPVEFGARLIVVPVADGGLAVVVEPLAPAPGTPLRFVFAPADFPYVVPAARWRVDDAGRVHLVDAHDRAVVLEWLPAATTTRVAWTAESGEPRAADVPTAEAAAALGWLTATTGHRVRVVDPEAPRVSWAGDPAAFADAVAACRGDGARDVVRIVGASRWTESEDALEVVDAAGGRWRCVVRHGGGVVRWEPRAASDDARPAGPILTVPPAGACYAHEPLRGPDGALVGLLSHDRC